VNKMVLQKLSFESYIKIYSLIGFGCGVILGVLMFTIGVLGGDLDAYIGNLKLDGIMAGIMLLFLAPLLSAFMCFLIAIITFPVVALGLKVTKGVNITALIIPVDEKPVESSDEYVNRRIIV